MLELPALPRNQNLMLVEVHVLRLQLIIVKRLLVKDLHRVEGVHYAPVVSLQEVFIMSMLVDQLAGVVGV